MRKLSHWLEELTPAESLDVYRELAYSHAREGGAVGRQIMRLIERGDFRALVEFELNYLDPAWTPHAVKQCRQALAYFQKLKYLDIGIDREALALKKFLEAEELCRQTNEVLSACRDGLLSWPNRVNSVFHAAVRKIAHVLGETPSLSELDLRFGPGATRGVKRKDASIRSKLAETIQCSEELLPIAGMLLGELPHLASIHQLDGERIEMHTSREGELCADEWVSVPVEIVPARLNFVPKSAKAYRSVCTEAGLNVMFQLGVGKIMAQRLAAHGVDIRDQSLNQRRALEGSLTGALATLDLSSASDTISREIVFELLPLEWAELLSWGRSSKVVLPSGKTITQEKFSSMGNGYTFPLETLIFWGLAAACCDRDSDATVYGDDIIVPTDKADLLREVLHYAGFMVNVGKSFSEGPFRESCGKDYFRGFDVRPLYSKEWVSGQSLFVAHNFYVRSGNFEMASEVESLIHPDLKLYGPDGYGDGHLLGEFRRELPHRLRSRGFEGFFFDTFTTKQRKDIRPNAPGDYILPQYVIYRRSDSRDTFIKTLAFQAGFDSDEYSGNRPGTRSIRDLVRDARHRLVVDAPLPLNFAPPVKGEKQSHKVLTLPGVDGYKKITIYTLGS